MATLKSLKTSLASFDEKSKRGNGFAALLALAYSFIISDAEKIGYKDNDTVPQIPQSWIESYPSHHTDVKHALEEFFAQSKNIPDH